jgi:FlaA1/EpsC-like NDP-sugar epimerase
VLDMGEPVRIIELARKMIELSGRKPDEEIAIEVIGRRPGEKLHEDLFNPDERPQPTPAEKILTAQRPALEPTWVEEAFARVEELVYTGDTRGLVAAVSGLSAERAVEASERASAPL